MASSINLHPPPSDAVEPRYVKSLSTIRFTRVTWYSENCKTRKLVTISRMVLQESQ